MKSQQPTKPQNLLTIILGSIDMLPPPKHPEVIRLRRSYVINRHNDNRINNLRCQAVELIYENKWTCTADFILGLSSEVHQDFAETKNTSPPAKIISEKITPTEIEVVKEPCKNCATDIDLADTAKRKTLHHYEKYCSPACKTKFYRQKTKIVNK